MFDKNGKRIPVDVCLSTSDNKFNPFTQFDDWLKYDRSMGYNSLETAARYDVSSADWPIDDQMFAYEDAVDRCVRLNLTGNRIKVTRPS